MKTPNNGEHLARARQSRSVTRRNARTTDKEHLVFEMVIQSVLMREHESAAEMTAPASQDVSNNKVEDLPSGVDTESAFSVSVSPHVGQGNTDECLSLGTGDFPSERGITGDLSFVLSDNEETIPWRNNFDFARETDNPHLEFEMMIQSVPMREYGSEAEMTSPLNGNLLSSNKLEFLQIRCKWSSHPYQQHRIVPCPTVLPEWKCRDHWKSVDPRKPLSSNDCKSLEGMRLTMSDLVSQVRITGETSAFSPKQRQSRGGNQTNSARTSDKDCLSETMMHSDLHGDMKRSTEMIDPLPKGRGNRLISTGDSIQRNLVIAFV